jgi:hypothetical protein
MWICKHCGNEFDFETVSDKGNHSRWCQSNPKRKDYQNDSSIRMNSILKDKLGELMVFDVECSVCNITFSVKEREKQFPTREKYYCSRSCANSIGGKAKSQKYYSDDVSYRVIAFRYHEKKCVVCDENKIVAVHHYNENHNDNRPENLIPLCPTHHQYMHSRFKSLIDDKVQEFIITFLNSGPA